MEEFWKAYRFLETHRAFYVPKFQDIYFDGALNMDVVKVNPETNSVDDDNSKNTKVQFWLECGKYDPEEETFYHDIDLDCGGDTFEQAIIKLAGLVKKHYGEDNFEEV